MKDGFISVACGAPNRYGYRDGKVVAYFQTEEYRNAPAHDARYVRQRLPEFPSL